MFATLVGNVVAVDRHVSGNLTQVTIAENFAGQTVTDGSWSRREDGFFRLRVWENNNQVGTNSTFERFLDGLKVGSTVEALVEITDLKTIKEGKTTDRRPIITAHRFSYVGGRRQEGQSDDRPVRAAQAASTPEEEGFQDIRLDESNDDEGYTPDPLSI